LLLSAVVTGLGGVWGLAFLLLPDAAGRALLGDTWSGARSVLVAAIVGQAANAVTLGPGTALYAMERVSITVRINAVQAPLVVLFGVGGVLLAGAQGAAWGMAAAFWVLVPVWWFAMRREAGLDAGRLREQEQDSPPVTDVQAAPPG
jgi:O-antigen/teichoic acid export membrane protein